MGLELRLNTLKYFVYLSNSVRQIHSYSSQCLFIFNKVSTEIDQYIIEQNDTESFHKCICKYNIGNDIYTDVILIMKNNKDFLIGPKREYAIEFAYFTNNIIDYLIQADDNVRLSIPQKKLSTITTIINSNTENVVNLTETEISDNFKNNNYSDLKVGDDEEALLQINSIIDNANIQTMAGSTNLQKRMKKVFHDRIRKNHIDIINNHYNNLNDTLKNKFAKYYVHIVVSTLQKCICNIIPFTDDTAKEYYISYYNEDYVYKKKYIKPNYFHIWGASLFNYLEHSDIDAIGLHRYTDQGGIICSNRPQGLLPKFFIYNVKKIKEKKMSFKDIPPFRIEDIVIYNKYNNIKRAKSCILFTNKDDNISDSMYDSMNIISTTQPPKELSPSNINKDINTTFINVDCIKYYSNMFKYCCIEEWKIITKVDNAWMNYFPTKVISKTGENSYSEIFNINSITSMTSYIDYVEKIKNYSTSGGEFSNKKYIAHWFVIISFMFVYLAYYHDNINRKYDDINILHNNNIMTFLDNIRKTLVNDNYLKYDYEYIGTLMKDYRQPTNTRKTNQTMCSNVEQKYPLCSSGTNNRYIMRTTIKQCRCIYLLLTNNDYMDKFHEWMNILNIP